MQNSRVQQPTAVYTCSYLSLSELKRKFLALMRRKRMITKYQDYNWYNSSVITKRKDNHMLQIIYYKEGKNDKVKMKIIRPQLFKRWIALSSG